MRLPFQWPNDSDSAEIQRSRIQITDFIRQRGTSQRPLAPRDVRAIGSSRSVLVLWALPSPNSDILGWRIYKDTEANLYKEIADRGTRQCSVESSAGAVTNFFVSSVNALGAPGGESPKVQVQGTATAEAGAPAVASTPPDTTSTSGTDTTSSRGWFPNGQSRF